jgi:hypothetical protein
MKENKTNRQRQPTVKEATLIPNIISKMLPNHQTLD